MQQKIGGLTDYRNVEKDNKTLTNVPSKIMMNQAASAAQLRQRPPMIPMAATSQSNSNRKQTITLVNARSTAAKIVLRNLNRYQKQQ